MKTKWCFGPTPPPHFLLSSLQLCREGAGSLCSPAWEPPPTHPGCRTCCPSLSLEMDEPRGGWAHTEHSGIPGRALSEQMEKSEDAPFPKFLF